MRYAQIKSGLKLHLVHEAGEAHRGEVITAGHLSQPVCGTKANNYRMNINVPLGNACRNCLRVHHAQSHVENEKGDKSDV